MAQAKIKKSSAGKQKKAASSTSAHVKNTSAAFSSKPSYLEMVKEAVSNGDRKGTSRQAIKTYMADTYDVDPESTTTKTALKKAIEKGVEEGQFVLPNGVTGKVKMAPKSVQKKHAEAAARDDEEEEGEEETDSDEESPKPPPKKAVKKSSKASSSAGSSSSSAKRRT